MKEANIKKLSSYYLVELTMKGRENKSYGPFPCRGDAYALVSVLYKSAEAMEIVELIELSIREIFGTPEEWQ